MFRGWTWNRRTGLWEGQAELIARFIANDAKLAGKVTSLTITFHLRPVTYAAALQRGLQIHREIEIPPQAVDLNLLVGNLASGKIGTSRFPCRRSGAARKGKIGRFTRKRVRSAR